MFRRINKRNLLAIQARLWLLTRAYKTSDKIVVIESDDWGSIRTSGMAAFNALKNKNYNLQASPYTLDCLESEEDLDMLYDLLDRYKFANNQSPVITANVIVANPDFDAIHASNFTEYRYESVVQTSQRYGAGHTGIIKKWIEGNARKLFRPQLHGREHIRFWEWINDLQNGKEEALMTFKYEMCGLPRAVSKTGESYFKPPYVSATILNENSISIEKLIKDGCDIFESIFNFKSFSTVAPNVAWTNDAEYYWNKNGINTIQGGFLQELHKKKGVEYIPKYTGQRNQLEQVYLVRNCTFEPSKSKKADYWKSTFNQVQNAFKLDTPAIISTHRVNFVGGVSKKNRIQGLKQLELLLNEILKKYPDTIFMSSDELGKQIVAEQ